MQDNLAAFAHQRPLSGWKAVISIGGGTLLSVQEGPKQLCAASFLTSGFPLLSRINYLYTCQSYTMRSEKQHTLCLVKVL